MNDPDLDLQRYYSTLENPSTVALEARVMRSVTAARPAARSGRRLAVLAASLAAAAAIGWALFPPPQKPKPVKEPIATVQEPKPEEIAGRVNGEPILWKDIHDRLKDFKPADVTPELRKSVLRQLAETVLIRQFAQRKALTVTDAELEEAVQQDRKAYGSEDEFAKVVRIRHGTMEEYRKFKRGNLLVFKTYRYLVLSRHTDPELNDLNLHSDEVQVADIRAFFDANPGQFRAIERISFMRIGLQCGNAQKEQIAQALIESLRRRYEVGAEFAMMAFFYSDIRRAKDFRDLGVGRKDLEGFYNPETITYLFDELKQGEVSPVIRDGNSLNLFKMEQKINQKAETFEEAQIKIRSLLENQRREKNRRQMVEWLRRKARIEPADLFEEK